MTLQATGPISLANLQTEFNNISPVQLGEFYQGPNRLVQPTVPASGSLSLANFEGAKAAAKGNVTLVGVGASIGNMSFIDLEEDVNRHYVVLGTQFSSGALPLQAVPTINGIACQTIGNRIASGGSDGGALGIFTLKLPTGTGVFTVGNVTSFNIAVYRVTGCLSMAVPLVVSTTRSTTLSLTSSANGCFFGICLDNFSEAPQPFPVSFNLGNIFRQGGTVSASRSTTGSTQIANLNGNQGNLCATFAYDLF